METMSKFRLNEKVVKLQAEVERLREYKDWSKTQIGETSKAFTELEKSHDKWKRRAGKIISRYNECRDGMGLDELSMENFDNE